jgi:hypothetical protein
MPRLKNAPSPNRRPATAASARRRTAELHEEHARREQVRDTPRWPVFQPFMAVVPRECVGNLHRWGQPDTFLCS